MGRPKPKPKHPPAEPATHQIDAVIEPDDAAFVLYRDALLFRVREAYPDLSDKQFIKEIVDGWNKMPSNEHALWRDASTLASADRHKLVQGVEPPLERSTHQPQCATSPTARPPTLPTSPPTTEMSHLRLHPSTSTSAQPWVTQASSVAGPSRPPLSRTPSPSPQPLVAIPLPPGSCTASPHLSRRRKLAGVETVNENPGGSKGKGKATAKARVPSGGERRAARGEGERANGSGRVCLAVDRWEERCEAPVGSVGGAFCAVHEAEAGVVRAEYERE